ncbi:uncharacterized protein Pyn_37541 [Prunus yedoensis var. nudiflora]|uniref:SWIM-type domain-containing protein n=1 Tax=Prunus yedoensis var. nudiflora TaxID=2094558 RepID=A0A314UHH8_PRUYE|nr:uncharacterized protein Pyn_37541 [Prunus yedoensis var. nudiflora]
MEHDIGPRIFGILEKTKKESAWCIPKLAGESLYEVKNHDGIQVVVDLARHSCSCRDGISLGSHVSMLCCHWAINGDHIAYVHDCYKKEAFMRAYSPMVHPMTSEDLWPKQGDHNRRSCPKAKEGSSSHVPSKPKVKKTIDTTSTKRFTRQSRAKQPVRRRLETGKCSQTAQCSEIAQPSETAQASETASASETAPASETAKKKRFKSPAKRIKFTKRNDGSQTVQGSQFVQGSESVQACLGSQTSQCSQPAQTSQTVHGSQPNASSSHPFASGTIKKRFKSPAKRMKFTNRKDLLDGY